LERGASTFDRFIEPFLFNARYNHVGLILDREIVAQINPSSLVPHQDWYVFSSLQRSEGITITSYVEERQDPLVVSAFVRELPPHAFDRDKWVRVLQGMVGHHYDWLAVLTMHTNRSRSTTGILWPLRRNRFTCASSVAHVLSEVGCARFPNWQNTIPPDFDTQSTFGTIGCDYGTTTRI